MVKLTRENFNQLPLSPTDGAWGTELMKLGAGVSELKELWNVSAPDQVLRVARSYVEAGARIILTNTFSANRIVLERHGAPGRTTELSRAGAAISRQAAGDRALVFGSIGPTGKLVSMKQLAVADAKAAFAEQAVALAEGGADAIVIETMADIEETGATLRACLGACTLPIGVSFTFDSGKNTTRTMIGVTTAQAWKAAAQEDERSFVGAHCGIGVDAYVERWRGAGAVWHHLAPGIKAIPGAPSSPPTDPRLQGGPGGLQPAVPDW